MNVYCGEEEINRELQRASIHNHSAQHILWTFYGILKPGGLLILTVNGAGAVLQFIYVTLFLIYAPRDIKVKSMKLVAIFDVRFLGEVIAVTLLAIHGSLRFTFVGILCAALTIGMYAAPLAVMVRGEMEMFG
ncbi:hypothetical protein ACSBR1_018699 [Camellia fascicularis]